MRGLQKIIRSAVLLVVFLGMLLPFDQRQTNAAPASGLRLQATLLQPSALEGGNAGLFVHTGALAELSLTIHYAANLISTFHAVSDRQGRYVFAWKVPLGMNLAGDAALSLSARRGSLSARWSGSLAVRGAPLPKLFVQPLQPRFLAGTTVGLFVSTDPGADLTYRLATDDGTEIASGMGTADAAGRLVIHADDTYLPHRPTGVTATVSIATQAGTRTRTAHFLLTPRPAMPLFVRTTHKEAMAGDAIDVFVSTRPGAALTATMSVTSTVVVTGTGVADKYGRWVYTAHVYAPIKRAHVTRITVQATSGLDAAQGHATFLLRPNPYGIGPNGIDRLATRYDPSPNLSRFFTSVPDKVILVSTEGQVLRAYEHGLLVHESYVTTGRPELPTVHGIFHVYLKQTPFEFISPWGPDSPWYYPPSWVRYWMPFIGGYGLHDAPWRRVYGPGTNLPHYDTDPGEPVGSHGCVNIPLADMVWLWNWTPVGTTVVVY